MAGVRLVLDSGAVSALAQGDIFARKVLEEALKSRAHVVIPAVVLAETTRGIPRDANVNRLVRTTEIAVIDERLARAAGSLLHQGHFAETIDSLVVAVADAEPGSAILTADTMDLRRLAAVNARTSIIGL